MFCYREPLEPLFKLHQHVCFVNRISVHKMSTHISGFEWPVNLAKAKHCDKEITPVETAVAIITVPL